MTNDDLKLAADFPAPSVEAWRELAEKSLRGGSFEKLISRTYEGFDLQPLYTIEDWPPQGDRSGLPGFAPFVRGARAAGPVAGGWSICQLHAHPDIETANEQILRDLQRGATAIGLKLGRLEAEDELAGAEGRDEVDAGEAADGILITGAEDMERTLRDVMLELAPVALHAGADFLPAAAALTAVARRREHKAEELLFSFGADPLGTLASEGELPVPVGVALEQMASLAVWTDRNLPNSTAVTVDSTPYHSAGATETQDLAASMSTAVAYLRALTEAGLEIDAACRQMVFRYAVGADFFMSIAKLRAARRLWSRIAQASGASPEASAMRQHAVTAPRMMSRRDPWVNMLRTTVACFAAGVGGADSVTALPYDASLGVPAEFGRRIARNTQVILQEESNLARVIDPAGGSWYLENLTERLAETAWKQFQEIERGGGMAEALKRGRIQEGLAASRSDRALNIARRKEAITGVSEFPNIEEPMVDVERPDMRALLKRAEARLAKGQGDAPDFAGLGGAELIEAAIEAAERGATLRALAKALAGGGGAPERVERLPQWRLAGEFEALRDAADAWKLSEGTRPRIFLANLGPVARHTARASYAKNFFEAGGIEAASSDGFTDPELAMRAFSDSGARVAVLCGPDDLYETSVPDFAAAMKTAGATRVYLAGPPGDQEAAWREAGVDEFIYMGCDALATLRGLHEHLGLSETEEAATGAQH